MARGGRREGSGRPRKSAQLHVLQGTARSDRAAKPATAGAAERLEALEARRAMTASICAELELLIHAAPTPGQPLSPVLKEFRQQCASLVQLTAAVSAIHREIRDTPAPPAPSKWDDFLVKLKNPAGTEGAPA